MQLHDLGALGAGPTMIAVPPQWSAGFNKYRTSSRVTHNNAVWHCRTTDPAGGCNTEAPYYGSLHWAHLGIVPANGMPLPEKTWTLGLKGHTQDSLITHQNEIWKCVDPAKCNTGEWPSPLTGWEKVTAGSIYVLAPITPDPVMQAPVVAPTTSVEVPMAVLPPIQIPIQLPGSVSPQVTSIQAPTASTQTLAVKPLTAPVTFAPESPAAQAATQGTTEVPLYRRPSVLAGAAVATGLGWWLYARRKG